jgi:hypothetical protein
MKAHALAAPFFAFLIFLIAGCEESQKPTEVSTGPQDLTVLPAESRGDLQSVADKALRKGKDHDDGDDDDARDATYKIHLRAILGRGNGTVCVTPIGGTTGFSARIEVRVRHMSPNASFYLQRAPEVGRPLGADGIGQRALGLWPWEQPNSPGYPAAPAFITFPLPNPGSLVMITTDKHGNGEAGFLFNLPAIADGILFDVVFRVVDAPVNPTAELRTKCFTVTVL